jgi:hypothetical protein
MLGYYPDFVVSRLERYATKLLRPHASQLTDGATSDRNHVFQDNNPKVLPRHYGYLRSLLWQVPHGASISNWKEFVAFRDVSWIAQFKTAGFRVDRVIRGPVSSPYAFGLDRLRNLLEKLGFSSEYIYITVKADQENKYLTYFEDI